MWQVLAEEENMPEPFLDSDDMPGPIDDMFFPDPFPPVIGGDVGWFRITSEPSNAEVIFDGSLVGYTPVTVEVYTTGAPYHTVRIEKSGYKPWSRELHENPAAGETKPVHATLGPDPCCKSLRITSAPSGAQITLNGVYLGTTPKTIDNLIIGTYQVTLTRSGYETWNGNIQVQPDSDNTIYVVLEPSFAPITSGTLMIESYPEGAEIVLDQTSRGTTPRTLTLPEGSHTLVLNRAGYQQYTTSVFIRDKENARITAYLVPVGTTPVQTPIPVIVASQVSDAPSYPLSYESLTDLGEKAAAEAHQNRNSFLAAVNDPQGVFAGDTEFVSVLAENGTLLADPAAETWIGEEIATYMDQNTVPYGQARQALARHGGECSMKITIITPLLLVNCSYPKSGLKKTVSSLPHPAACRQQFLYYQKRPSHPSPLCQKLMGIRPVSRTSSWPSLQIPKTRQVPEILSLGLTETESVCFRRFMLSHQKEEDSYMVLNRTGLILPSFMCSLKQTDRYWSGGCLNQGESTRKGTLFIHKSKPFLSRKI
jgi:hypothetical protein